jgi:hypothetical protein
MPNVPHVFGLGRDVAGKKKHIHGTAATARDHVPRRRLHLYLLLVVSGMSAAARARQHAPTVALIVTYLPVICLQCTCLSRCALSNIDSASSKLGLAGRAPLV